MPKHHHHHQQQQQEFFYHLWGRRDEIHRTLDTEL
jgi:hypothetical protein